MYRNILYTILIVLIVIGAWYVATDINFQQENDRSEVSVRYQAREEFKPDIAEIVLGVKTEGMNPEDAFAENNEKINKINEELGKLEGLTIETLNYRIQPLKRAITGNEKTYFEVVNQMKITTENMEEPGIIISRAIEAGANQVLALNYSLTDEQQARERVIEKALAGLKEKVSFVQKELAKRKRTLKTLNVNDNVLNNDFSYGVRKLEGAGESVPQISLPGIEIVVNVNAVYSLQN